MRKVIFLSILIFSTLGSWVGAALDHGNLFGFMSFLVGSIGAFVGVWVGYKGYVNFIG